MNFVWTIVIVVAFSLFAILSVFLMNWVFHKRNLAKYDNYGRELSREDMDFLIAAQEALDSAAKVKTPKRYGIFLYTAFIPTMFMSWAVLAGFGILLLGFVKSIIPGLELPKNTVHQIGGEVNGALIAGVFAGLFLAGGVLYGVSLLKQSLSNFIALNSNINGFDRENVKQGLLLKLEHQLRSRVLFSTSKFSVDAFLNGVNRTYRDSCLKVFYGCMIAVLVFGILDLRSQRIFFTDKIVSSGPYFSLGINEDISYSAITHVEIDCYRDDGHPKGSYTLFRGPERIARIHIKGKTVEPLGIINQKIRSEGSAQFISRKMKDDRKRLTEKCVQQLGEKLGQADVVKTILETDN